MNRPIVSVLMPAYNAALHIREAIDSILAQTFINFEFVIINDGSQDETEAIILSYYDRRIKYYQNESNLGIVQTLNKGIKLCGGQYIARMDADDIALPNRLAHQVDFMTRHQNIVACGTLYGIFGTQTQVDVATDPQDIRCDMALFCQFAHSMMMIRKSVLEASHLQYREDYKYAEDYKLWTELLQYGDMANVPELLGYIRQCESGISIMHSEKQKILSDKVRRDYLKTMGINPQILLSEILNNETDIFTLRQVLIDYQPLAMKASIRTWLRRNFITGIKRYIRSSPIRYRYKQIVVWGSFLSLKEKVVLLLKG